VLIFNGRILREVRYVPCGPLPYISVGDKKLRICFSFKTCLYVKRMTCLRRHITSLRRNVEIKTSMIREGMKEKYTVEAEILPIQSHMCSTDHRFQPF
jgi:hypothetical protein